MKRTLEPKGILPNKIPKTLIKACKKTAEEAGLSLNEWLQIILIKETKS